ncbi:MAG TPA: hypothetical protein PLP04_20080 [Bryobacteraceae bacterium]|nr:hypothetical protein [Bryobacteraceae bacterium]HPQ17536.1 hypothetical protein [Bryobacteraceae bacterium]
MRRVLVSFLLSAAAVLAQDSAFLKQGTVSNRAVMLFSNDKLELAIAVQGGSLLSLVMRDDPSQLSPFGDTSARIYGHFVCVDGFGPSSAEERAAGLPGHGEAHRQPWEMTASGKQGNTASVTFRVKLPLVQETLTRSFHIVDGENVIYVDSELESHLAFDRPVNWAEHLTIASPFLEPESLVVDLPAARSKTRKHPQTQERTRRRLASDREFTWPNAPLVEGGTANVRFAPPPSGTGDHVTSLIDPSRRLGWVTALNTKRRALLGYIFRREEYPWLQDWQSYETITRMNRGLEFGTQPFDVPRREVIDLRSMFGAPVYRWLPAKSKITTQFLLFWVRALEGMTKIDDVRIENGRIIVEDRAAQKRIELTASRPL